MVNKKLINLFFLFSINLLNVASASQEIKLQLKWTHEFNFAGYYAAVEKGYYQEAGLEVTVKEGKPGMDFVDEVISGRANYGIEMPELLIARNQGKPVVVLAAIFQHSPQIILARSDSGIKSPHNLIGKKIMWRFDSAAEIRAMLVNENVPLEKIEFKELSWDINDLIEGRVDAIQAYITDQPLSLELAGIDHVILSPINYGIDFYGDCLFTSEKEIAENPERVKAFRKASLRGWAYAMEHPQEIMEIIKTKYHTKSSLQYMQHEFEHIRKLMLPALIEIGHMNPGRWERIGDTFVKLGMLDPDYSMDGFLYDPNPKTINKKIMIIFWILIGVAIFITVSALILFVFNRKLNREVQERTEHLSIEINKSNLMREEILKRRAEFEAMFNAITDAIVFVDQQRRIVMINPAFNRMFGYGLEEVAGQTTQLIYADPDNYTRQGKIRFQPEAKIEEPVFENRYRRKNGTIFFGETLGAHVRDQNGDVLGFIGVIRDISDRKKSEEERENLQAQLRQAHKMEAIGTLAGGIAHDFNNILAAILGYAEMAGDGIPDYSPAKYQIEEVIKAGNRAKDLVKHILSFSRNEAQRRVPVQIHQVVTEALNLLRASIPSNIQIRQNLDPQCGNILADQTQIHQVVINLCTNAAQSMDETGGVMDVELISKQLSSDDPGNEPGLKAGHYVILNVSDHGIGIDPKNIDRIFDPYFTTKEIGKGSGMGLAVVKGIVNSHDGVITVKSTFGKGTAFNVYFPKIEAQSQEETEDNQTLPTGTEKILIVDDEQSVAEITKNWVQALGYQVTAITSSMEALELFRSQPESFDLIITDQTMPVLTGDQLAIKLMEIRPDIPIIICSGYSSRIDAEKADNIGVKAFIMKPVDKKNLAKIIRNILD